MWIPLKIYTEHSTRAQQMPNKWSLSGNGEDTLKKNHLLLLVFIITTFYVNTSLYANQLQNNPEALGK